MASIACLGAMAAGAIPLANAQTSSLKVPSGGDPALSCGQTPNGRAYWTEYGFCDIPVKGPAAAKGLIIWSHGMSGAQEQYRFAPPPIVRRLASIGWDVIKINRNNLYEHDWTSSGVRHRDDALERVRAAKAQGYKTVMLAGQSYGGAISLEANARSTDIDGVLALSPGHGSDVGQAGGGGGGRYYNLDTYLLDAVAAQKAGRVVVLVAPDDLFHPNRSTPGSYIGPRLRQALAGTGRPYVVFDETGPIHGHGAGTTNQFSNWFGACLVRFLDPAQAPKAGETTCAAPNPVPQFLVPANIQLATPGADGPARWFGVWLGSYGEDKLELMIVIERIEGSTATILYMTGAGPQRDRNMVSDRYPARIEGNRIIADRGQGRSLELIFAPDGKRADVVHRASDRTLSGSLSHGGQTSPAPSSR
jgi:hypothetical protein